jgi:hypothetical protein
VSGFGIDRAAQSVAVPGAVYTVDLVNQQPIQLDVRSMKPAPAAFQRVIQGCSA